MTAVGYHRGIGSEFLLTCQSLAGGGQGYQRSQRPDKHQSSHQRSQTLEYRLVSTQVSVRRNSIKSRRVRLHHGVIDLSSLNAEGPETKLKVAPEPHAHRGFCAPRFWWTLHLRGQDSPTLPQTYGQNKRLCSTMQPRFKRWEGMYRTSKLEVSQ